MLEEGAPLGGRSQSDAPLVDARSTGWISAPFCGCALLVYEMQFPAGRTFFTWGVEPSSAQGRLDSILKWLFLNFTPFDLGPKRTEGFWLVL